MKGLDMGFPRNNFSNCLRLSVILVLAIGSGFWAYVYAEKQIDLANNQRYITRVLIDELRRWVEDSALGTRSSIVTGNPRNFSSAGEPRDDGTFSNERGAGLSGENSKTSVLLEERMEQVGFTRQELDRLIAADAFSNKPTVLERKAASSPAFGEDYRRQRAEIVEAIDAVMGLADQRTQKAVELATRYALMIRNVLVGLASTLLVLLWICGRMFKGMLGDSPEHIYESIVKLGSGNFADVRIPGTVAESSVMGFVAQAREKLAAMDGIRKQSEKSLELAAKVFSDAREGIFLTDEKGFVIDVNSAFELTTGYTRQESIGRYSRILETRQHDVGFIAGLWESLRRDGRWRGEIWGRRKDGDIYASLLSMSAVTEHSGELICYLGMLADITSLKRHQQEIEKIAFHDALTQLPNRPLLSERMQQALAQVDRSKNLVAVACLDLDGFKAVNDNFGHEVGDRLLIEVASRLQSCVRGGDTVARLGGDEFAIVLSDIHTKDDCEGTLQRILKALTLPYNLADQLITTISGSIGYTIFPEDKADPDTLLRHADHAMYTAKQAGKNRFQRHDIRDDKRIQANWWALARIEKAMTNREFRLYVQPKVNLKTGLIVGAEALIRWQHPLRGLIMPAEFLPLIEDKDIAIQVGDWVIEEALGLLQAWCREGKELPLSVNVCAQQMRDEGFYQRLRVLLSRFPDVAPDLLEFEIVESTALNDLPMVSGLIEKCQGLGVRFALDDFGTGYSALTYLKRLSANTLKIDQSFVRNIPDDASDLAIVRGVIGMGQAFHKEIVAEGVETRQQADCLLNLGCEIAQGYVFARPMPADDVLAWIEQFHLSSNRGDPS